MISAKELVSKPFDEVKADKECVLALIYYSRGYFGTTSVCERVLRENYNKIKIRLSIMENKNRKYVLKKGLKYVRATSEHISRDNFTDEKAIIYLEKGFLKLSDFEPIPEQEEPKEIAIEKPEKKKRSKK